MKKLASRLYTALILVFLYAPIIVMIVFSFNDSKNRSKWEGFSLRWYNNLFNDSEIIKALGVSLSVALIAMIAATVIGTLAAIGLNGMNKKLRGIFMSFNSLPMVNPEIVTGISLMLLFVVIYKTTGLLKPGYLTLVLAHVTFCVPYVVLSVLPKLRQMNPYMFEAAQDLGCPPVKAFFKVVVPEIMPGIITGAMMAFTLSLDDFIISYFTSGSSAQTLPVIIYSMTKRRLSPKINALSTLLFVVIMLLLVIINMRQLKELGEQNKKRKGTAAR